MNFFFLIASAANIPTDNPNSNKTLLGGGVSSVLINGKPAVINGLRKFKNCPS